MAAWRAFILLFLEAGIVGRDAETIGEHFKPILATHLIAASLLFINSESDLVAEPIAARLGAHGAREGGGFDQPIFLNSIRMASRATRLRKCHVGRSLKYRSLNSAASSVSATTEWMSNKSSA